MTKKSRNTSPVKRTSRRFRKGAEKKSIQNPSARASQSKVAKSNEARALSTHAVSDAIARLMPRIGTIAPSLPKGVSISAVSRFGARDTAVIEEPLISLEERRNIQGNIVPGFNKDHQQFFFYRIGSVKRAKKWLQTIAPIIASMEEVLAFVRLHREMRFRRGVLEPGLNATWVNIAFSYSAIAKLTNQAEADKFRDASFRQGLAERSAYLGDPTDSSAPGHKRNWFVGGPKNEADILVIVAADDPNHLLDAAASVATSAKQAGLWLLFEQPGDTLPDRLRGHEHFGFKDGVSQPGIRGTVSTAPGDFITPRYIEPVNSGDPADDRADYFAKPGQLLVWPGQFLLGLPRQSTEQIRESDFEATEDVFPSWGRLGSYLVCRRLRQDVQAFWKFVIATAASVGIPAEHFASMLVGRWPSGAPLMRSPTADDPALAGDPWANNHFIFDDDSRPSNLVPISGYPGDSFAQSRADVLGMVCPHFAHIRKVNPRDAATDLGKPADTMLRLILRRGIPFGEPIVGVDRPSPKLIKRERGLMFICYGATIEDQFEFLMRRWSNSDIQPNLGGHDPVIGQTSRHGSRTRYIDFPTPSGPRRIELKQDWITPTGGGYFFAPPIDAISNVLGASAS